MRHHRRRLVRAGIGMLEEALQPAIGRGDCCRRGSLAGEDAEIRLRALSIPSTSRLSVSRRALPRRTKGDTLAARAATVF
jgi:hypothetical protein